MNRLFLVIIYIVLQATPIQAKPQIISPTQFGLMEAATGEERYHVLYKTHSEAIKMGYNIVYKGIDTIKIDIPRDAKPIPLAEETDFGNTVIVVRNNSMNYTLFSMQNPIEKYDTRIEFIEGKKKIDETGTFLVLLEDSVPWVKNRKGYDYGFIRKDILYVNKGEVKGSVISSYRTTESKPLISRSFVSTSSKIIQNLSVLRDSESTYKTFVIKIENQYNVIINNISIKTPPNKWFGDMAIRLDNCYKVRVNNTSIEGTYSQKDKYGYGITLINVSDVVVDNLKANADWGIFGNNNVSNITLNNCDINRFDVHCYGKDIFIKKCVFRNLYNQFSSMYGTVSFTNCEFIDFVPVLFEPSYNAYTKFNLRFKNCKIVAGKKRCYLISGGNVDTNTDGSREELRKQEYPNLFIDGLEVTMPDSEDVFYIYKFNRHLLQWPNDTIPGIIKIKRLSFNPNKNVKIETTNLQSVVRYPESEYIAPILIGGAVTLLGVSYCLLKNKNNKHTYS